jgi:hypothetical protein
MFVTVTVYTKTLGAGTFTGDVTGDSTFGADKLLHGTSLGSVAQSLTLVATKD